MTADNIKTLDWNYWKEAMQDWAYDDFSRALVTLNTDVEETANGQGLITLRHLSIGTVVTDYTRCTAYKGSGESDTDERCNCELLWVTGQQDTVGFLVTTKHVQDGEQLTWFQKLYIDTIFWVGISVA